MKIAKMVAFAAVVMAASPVMAQETEILKFRGCEFNLDLFGIYMDRLADDILDTDIEDGTWGGGVGVNYFITPHFGIGSDIVIPDNRGNFVDAVNGSLFARLPIETVGLAPYAFGGGGRTTDRIWGWTGHGGLGLEFRFTPYTGVFADARYVWAERTSDDVLFRAGLRLAF